MRLLDGFRVARIGPGLAAAVCGRLLADLGATVGRDGAEPPGIAQHTSAIPRFCVESAGSRQKRERSLLRASVRSDTSALGEWLDHGVVRIDPAAADLIVTEGSPATLLAAGRDTGSLRQVNPRAAIVLISPFGQTGPRAEEQATDLTLFFASGIARMLTGQVDDLAEPPMAPVGRQSAFIGGLAAACAGMHAALSAIPSVIDVSIHEALATLAITELTRAGMTGKSWSRKRLADGNGATVCILPARDGFAAISPREDRQWASWLRALGSPAWGKEARFAKKADRVANWDALHALICEWSRDKPKRCIAETAQAAHVPSFPLCEPAEHLESAQLAHRGFFRTQAVGGREIPVPGSPFGVTLAPGAPVPAAGGPLPLSGIRVLDFSWVIAGPTATRYLAAMGAEVIKVEAPGRGDPGRASELHAVLGQAKSSVVLDLKQPEAVRIATALAARSDVLVENFATGVMDRLGLGTEALRAVNPNLIIVSASGLGRTGPESHAVAYGTLLQCYAGFAGLNRHPGMPPRVGMAWLDPMCGLMLACVAAASIWRRRTGAVARVDFSMTEAMLWTMAEPLLGEPAIRAGEVVRGPGDDAWIAAGEGAGPGVPAATSADLIADAHLQARGFWEAGERGVTPGLPWIASFGKASGPAPALGADTDRVLRDILGKSAAEIAGLRASGVFGG